MGHTVFTLLFDFGEDVADGFATDLGEVNDVRPGTVVVEVVLKGVVLRQVQQVAVLDLLKILDRGATDLDHEDLRFMMYLLNI